MNKIFCIDCEEKAVWLDLSSASRQYCDDCVPRGCGCNGLEDSEEQSKDDRGRLYPCCEYFFDPNGFDI